MTKPLDLDALAARCVGQPSVGYPLSSAEVLALIERVRVAEARIDAVRALCDDVIDGSGLVALVRATLDGA